MLNATTIKQGLSWSTVATILKVSLQLVQFIILAKYLSLSELGLIAFIGILVSFSQVLGDAGLSNAIIYFDELSKGVKKQLYTLSLFLSCVIALGIYLLIPVLGSFFDLINLQSFSLLIALIAFCRVAVSQPIAIMQKALKFKVLAYIEIFAQLLSLFVICLLLHLDYGVSSAVYGQLLLAILLLGSGLVVAFRDIGIMLPRLKEISSPAKYGLYQSLEGLVSMLSRQCDQLIILKFLGAEILGIYSYIKDLIGKPLLQLINPIINRLLFPLLVKLPFSERRAFYMRSLLVLSTFTMPLYLGLAYFSEPFLIFILNNSWGEHHLVASLLALTYLMMAMITPCSSLLQAMGAVKRSFYWNVAVTIIRVSVIFASVPFGIEVMLGALLILQAFILFAHWYVLIRPMIHISLFSFFKVPSIPLTLAVIIIFISSILQPLMSIDEFWQAILYAFVVIISLVISVYLLKSRIHIIDKLVQR